jgi:hypothetical protein
MTLGNIRSVSGWVRRAPPAISEVAEHALKMETGRLGTVEQRRIAAALELLGWERGKRTANGIPWVRKAVQAQPADESEDESPAQSQPSETDEIVEEQPDFPNEDIPHQKVMTAALMKLRDTEAANMWMRNRNPKLAMKSPAEVCLEPGGVERCVRWGGRPQRHRCAIMRVVRTGNKGAARDEH